RYRRRTEGQGARIRGTRVRENVTGADARSYVVAPTASETVLRARVSCCIVKYVKDAATRSRDARRAGYRSSVDRSQRQVLAIVRNRLRVAERRQVLYHRAFERLAGNRNRGRHGNQNAQAFRVQEEEQLILNDRAANRSCPLVRVAEGLWVTDVVIEPIVGVHRRAVPVINCVPVESVSARLRDVVDLKSRESAEAPRVRVGDHVCFLHFV